MAAAVLAAQTGSWGPVVRRTMACAVLRAGRCDPALASELVSRVRLVWDPAVPEEVELLAPGPLRWYLDRDVLVDGLRAPAADGPQVFVAPLPLAPVRSVSGAGPVGELRHEIVLDPRHDRVALQLRTRDLAGFIAAITSGTSGVASTTAEGAR